MAQLARELPVVVAAPARTAIRIGKRGVLCLALLIVPLILTAASTLAISGNLATATYSLQRLQTERDAWRAKNDQLKLELSRAQSLAWVEHEAVSRLGMRKTSDILYLPTEPSMAPGSERTGR